MNKNVKRIAEILIIAIMTLVMLLILPENAFAIDRYKFNCYGDGFEVTGIGQNDEYALSWELWQADSIEDFDKNHSEWNNPGKTVEADFSKAGTDGYYMMRWRKSIRNRVCK